jgi:hypothetical protein
MTRPLLLAGALLGIAGGLRGQDRSLDDSLEKIQKEFNRALSRAGKNPPDRATIDDLVERAIALGIDQKSERAGFEPWYFVLDLVPHVAPEKQAGLYAEAMDALIEGWLDDDRMAYFLMNPPWYLPESLQPKAKEYAEWIARDSKARGVQFAKGWCRCCDAMATVIDASAAAPLIAELEALQKQCATIPDLGRKWSSMVDDVLDQLKVIGTPARETAGIDLDGVAFKLSDYRGKVVLLDFWGYW